MSLVLYRKYRPSTFKEVIGQKNTIKILISAITGDRVAHAYLFTGPRGTGKTTIARILAKTINCLGAEKGEPCNKCVNCLTINEGKTFDIVEIDAASNTGVDNIRELKATIGFSPSHLKYKVFIIDEVHMLSKGAFNALLKTLEEPPAHAIFIMATTEIHKIPATIISRSQRFDFQKLKLNEMVARLSEIAKKEKINIAKKALETIALASDGGMRDAESLLGQIISLADGEEEITLSQIKLILGLADTESVLRFIEYISEVKTKEAIIFIGEIEFSGQDLDQFCGSIIDTLRKMLLIKISADLKKNLTENSTEEQIKKISDLVDFFSEQELLWLIKKLVGAKNDIKSSSIVRLPLELVAIEYDFLKNKRKLDNSENVVKAENLSDTALSMAEGVGALSGAIFAPKPLVIAKNNDGKNNNLLISKKNFSSGEENKKQKIEINKKEEENQEEKKIENTSRNIETKNPQLKLEEIQSGWSNVLRISKKYNHSISAFLKLSAPVEIKGELLVIATPYKFHAEKLSEMANRDLIGKVITEVFTVAKDIKIKIIQEEKVLTQPIIISENNLAPSELVKSEKKITAENANFTTALEIFGGEIE